jgi:hypothetical protein
MEDQRCSSCDKQGLSRAFAIWILEVMCFVTLAGAVGLLSRNRGYSQVVVAGTAAIIVLVAATVLRKKVWPKWRGLPWTCADCRTTRLRHQQHDRLVLLSWLARHTEAVRLTVLPVLCPLREVQGVAVLKLDIDGNAVSSLLDRIEIATSDGAHYVVYLFTASSRDDQPYASFQISRQASR